MVYLQFANGVLRKGIFGVVFPHEQKKIDAALHTLRNAYPGHDNPTTVGPLEKYRKENAAFIAELSSKDPKRQRKALSDKKLLARLALEELRNDKLNGLHYFKQLGQGKHFTCRTAVEASNLDSHSFGNHHVLWKTEESAAARAKVFPDIADDFTRLIMSHMVFEGLGAVTSQLTQDDPNAISEKGIIEKIETRLQWFLTTIEDEDVEKALDTIEALASRGEPLRIMHYMASFKGLAWRSKFKIGRFEKKSKAEAEATERQRSDKAQAQRVATEKRKLVENQLTFVVKDETLDVSMYGWPELEQGADTIKLFENLKSAFARSTKLRFEYRPDHDTNLLIERSIRSMSLRQLACVKNLVWADRTGLQKNKKEGGAVWRGYAQRMFELLNADGHAHAWISDGRTYSLERLDPELAAEWRADVDKLWFSFADTFQKWIGTDTFSGELTRWIVEDPGESGGWATSR